MITRTLVLACLLVSAQAEERTQIFAPILRELKQSTSVPVRLPDHLPDLGQGQEPLYAVLEFARPAGYSVILAFTPDCNGASVCRVGTLSARRVTKGRIARGKRVTLAGGVAGAYREGGCGAGCSDSVVTWRDGTVEYSAGVKAGSETDVVKLANAILQNKS